MTRTRILLLAFVLLASNVLLLGCRSKGDHKFSAQPTLTPGNPVYLVDSTSSTAHLLGDSTNPLYVQGTGGGGSTTIAGAVAQGDGGGITNSWAVQVNDGTNVLGTTTHPVVMAGSGTAGSAATAVMTVQGIASGTALAISGSITQGTAAAGSGAWPVDPTAADIALNSLAHLTSAGVSLSVKTTAGTLVGINVTNEGTVTGWLMCYDQAAPDAGGAGGTAPIFPGIRVAATGQNYYGIPESFPSHGIQCYSSATVSTLTTASAPNMTITAVYR